MFTTLQDVGEGDVEGDYLETVFENGVITKEYSFEEVIANSKNNVSLVELNIVFV